MSTVNTSIKNTLRIKMMTEKNGAQVLKMIITHPMESGYRRDSRRNELIPADYIETLRISIDGRTYLKARLTGNISTNPFMYLTFNPPLQNEKIMTVSWTDNHGIEHGGDIPIEHALREVVNILPAEASTTQEPDSSPTPVIQLLDTVPKAVCNKPLGGK